MRDGPDGGGAGRGKNRRFRSGDQLFFLAVFFLPAVLALAHSLLLERVYAPYIREQLGEEEPEEDDG